MLVSLAWGLGFFFNGFADFFTTGMAVTELTGNAGLSAGQVGIGVPRRG